ncbi:hypothetical protein DMNBHIDG_00799 [Candidatus Methanoperedenaceae archaeon GB37]|nr:hypothetical protein DMNBHIDG_00799 [Candidatus Methanoperedenaceae archaeon GB37]
MMEEKYSPLHLEPIYKGGTFVGYKLRSKEHEGDNKWVRDVIKRKDYPNVKLEGKSFCLKDLSNEKRSLSETVFFCAKIYSLPKEKG